MRTTARGREGGRENDLNVPVEAGSRYVALTGSCVERWEGWGALMHCAPAAGLGLKPVSMAIGATVTNLPLLMWRVRGAQSDTKVPTG